MKGMKINHGCSGGMLLSAMEYAMKWPVQSDDIYNYMGEDQLCRYDVIKANT